MSGVEAQDAYSYDPMPCLLGVIFSADSRRTFYHCCNTEGMLGLEIYNNGVQAFAEVKKNNDLIIKICTGAKPPQPVGCEDEIYSL
jgi:hypothetical protein